MTAATLFVFRARDRGAGPAVPSGHPWTTVLFVAVAGAVVATTFLEHPGRSLLGWTLVAVGLPVYALWRRRAM